mgnify:CR=1 FL=1
MFNKKVKSRIFFLFFSLFFVCLLIFFILKSLEENVVYFFSPTEIYNKSDISLNKKVRIGGLVKEGSINRQEDTINFIITDLKNEIVVTYKGLVPNLFSEGKGVVAEGFLKDQSFLIAEKILAKHDENYMPPEVAESLKDK